MITTTLNEIKKHNPCTDGWKKLLRHLGKTKADDEPLALLTILDSNGLNDCLWALRTRPDLSNLWRHFAVDCAEDVKHLMTDERSLNALKVARAHANGTATDEELAAAAAAAWDAWDAAWSAWSAGEDAAWSAARSAARSAAWAAWDKQEARLRKYLTTGERVIEKGQDDE